MMKCLKILAAVLFLAPSALAQSKPATNTVQTNVSAEQLQQWVNDNFDFDPAQFLDQIDQDKVRDFFSKFSQQLDATNIFDFSQLKPMALQVLPVLKAFEETQPYAVWLQARIDEMDDAQEMQKEYKSSKPKGNLTIFPAEPPLKFQRSFWKRRLAERPWPPLAKTYVPKLKSVFISERVPPELVWVAGVESSFDPRARSPAGAAGMFQLMPATARTEHLSLWPFDERYQPEKSAKAAALYLRSLHQRYGDWALALAAYNVGPARVDKVLTEHDAHSFDAIAKWLPAETQMYVPKVEATIRLREGLALNDLRIPPG
jgi:membrane-bound lytic murein transglycosylase D